MRISGKITLLAVILFLVLGAQIRTEAKTRIYLQDWESGLEGWISKYDLTIGPWYDPIQLVTDLTAPSPVTAHQVMRVDAATNYLSPLIQVIPGESYSVGCWIRWESGGWPFVGISRYSASGYPIGLPLYDPETAPRLIWLIGNEGYTSRAGYDPPGSLVDYVSIKYGWRWYEKEFTAPAGTAYVRIMTELFKFAEREGDPLAYFDDISMYSLPSIFFVDPFNPVDGATIESSSVEIKTKIIKSPSLTNVTFKFNGTDYTIYDNSLVLMYNFDNVTALGEDYDGTDAVVGDLVADISGKNNHGYLSDTTDPTKVPTWTKHGKHGGAFDFTGNQTIQVPHNPDNSLNPGSDDFAIVFWILARDDYEGEVLAKGSTGTWYKVKHAPSGDDDNLYWELNTDGTDAAVSSSSVYNDNKWHFVVAQRRNSNTAHLWIDGVLDGTAPVSGSISNSENLAIGSNNTQNGNFINSMLDEIRIYKKSFTGPQIQELYYSNLSKYDLDKWLLYVNQSNLTDGLYTYRSSATIGEASSFMTEERSLTVDLPYIPLKGPYLQNVTEGSIVIMWETDTGADTHVAYDDDSGMGDPTYVDISESVTIHEVQLTGLTANTTYYYNVTSGGLTSAKSTFTTAPATFQSFRFVVYGDTQANPAQPDSHAEVVEGIIESEPKLVLHIGDCVNDGITESLWGTEFFTPARDLMINTPIYPVMGNLENNASWFYDFFSLTNNEQWYAFTYGNVRFIGLDTNAGYSPTDPQYSWLKAELRSPEYSAADWHIVYLHHPPYTVGETYSDDTNVQTYLVPLFEQYDVDMVFSGHTHAYERYYNNGIYYIVTGGGGGPLDALLTDEVEPVRQFGESVHHHCVIDVGVPSKTLTLRARYNNGDEFDTITLTKARPAPPKNVFFFIGDGMGEELVKAASIYLYGASGKLSFDSFPYQGELTIHSANSSTTDSAAAGTALATGYKVNDGVVSVARPSNDDYLYDAELPTLLEYGKARDKRTGLVLNRYMTNATPATFGAHEADRNSYTQIANDYLTQTRPNILFGGNSYMSGAEAAGYTVVTDAASMLALDTESVTMVSGQFGSGDMPYELDGLGSLPHLSQMTSTALDILSNDPDGFFLMVEGARIDQACHSNDLARAITETIEFANAVQVAIEWAAGRNDTLILVTSDHETGGLTVTGNNGAGTWPSVIWGSTGHTTTNVPVYAWGMNSHLITDTAAMDNTDMFDVVLAEEPIQVVDPGYDAINVSTSTNLKVTVYDPDYSEDPLDVTFYGREKPSFTIVVLPDTQKYVLNGAYPHIFTSQTQWIVDNAVSSNIVFMTHEGDIVDTWDSTTEWAYANNSISLLDGVVPYGLAVGNHDKEDVTNHSTYFNQTFPYTRYENEPWYGGHYPPAPDPNGNDNSYQLFSVGGDDYIVLHLEDYPDDGAPGPIIAWADDVLKTHSTHRAIITTHGYMSTNGTYTGKWGSTQYIRNLVEANDNVYFVLCGHFSGEYVQTTTVNGRLVHELLADYQDRTNGGNGWLRIMRFEPDEDKVYVETYSTWLDAYEADNNSQFVLDFPMTGTNYSVIGTNTGVASGESASVAWPDLSMETQYQWYVTIADSTVGTTMGPVWSFTTGSTKASNPNPANAATDVDVDADLSWTAGIGAVSHDVYFGTDPASLYLLSAQQSGTTYEPGTLLQGITYYWIIDEHDSVGGINYGNLWSFTTVPPDPVVIVPAGSVWKYDDTNTDFYSLGWPSVGDSGWPEHAAPLGFGDSHIVLPELTMGTPRYRCYYFTHSFTVTSAYQSLTVKVLRDDGCVVYLNGAEVVRSNMTSDVIGHDTWSASSIGGADETTYFEYSVNPTLLTIGTNRLAVDVHQCNETSTDLGFDLELEGVMVTEPPQPASNPNPSDEASQVDIDAVLSWTAGTGTVSHDVYFGTDTDPRTNTVVNQPGNTFDPGTLEPSTIYYWAVDEVNPGGTTEGETWSFTTATTPGQASNPTPADITMDVSVDAVLNWTEGSDTTSHDVYLGTNPASLPQVSAAQAETSYDPGGLNGSTTYYWRIDEVGPGGTTEGPTWSFTTIVMPPGQASNPNPTNGALYISIYTDLSWTEGTDTTSHNVYFGTYSNPRLNTVVNQPGNSYDPGTLAPSTNYFWAVDEVGSGWTTAGEIWSFTTAAVPGQASNPNPTDAATGVDVDVDLSWTAGSGVITAHDVYFGTDEESLPLVSDGQTETNYDPGVLNGSKTYYWRVDEVGPGGTTTGETWSFTTIAMLPGQASNPYPPSPSWSISYEVVLSWTEGSDTTSHNIYFGEDPNPRTNAVVNQQGNTYDPPGSLNPETTYYWAVDEVGPGGTTPGPTWTFTTLGIPPVISNVEASDINNVSATITWTTDEDSNGLVRYGTVIPPAQEESDLTMVTSHSVTLTGLSPGTTYYYEVSSTDASGSEAIDDNSGEYYQFTTQTILFTDGFESGELVTGGWIIAGNANVKNKTVYTGAWSAELAGISSIEKILNTTGFDGIHVKYARTTNKLDTGEFLTVDWSPDGTTWNNLESTQDTDWAVKDWLLPPEATSSDFRIRFSSNASSTSEYAYIDDVEIKGTPAIELAGMPLSTAGVSNLEDGTMHVDAILVVSAVELDEGLKIGEAQVVILDNNGNSVSGAIVTGTFSEDINETVTAVTDGNGLAVLRTTSTTTSRCHLTFNVNTVGHPVLYYNPIENVIVSANNYDDI